MPHRVGGCVFACALRDELVAQARGGDPAALEWLVRALPQDLPSAVRLGCRNDRIRHLGFWLSSEMPGSSAHCIAALLAAAGRRIEAGRGLGDAPPFDVLADDERARLAAEIGILKWSPSWPGWRQLLRVLSFEGCDGRTGLGETCHPTSIAMTKPSAGPSGHGHPAEEPTDHRHRSTQVL